MNNLRLALAITAFALRVYRGRKGLTTQQRRFLSLHLWRALGTYSERRYGLR